MGLFDSMNARAALYRQVVLFGFQKDDPVVVKMCIKILNSLVPKTFQKPLTELPIREGKLESKYHKELWLWCEKNLEIVEEAHTKYFETIAMKYQN